MHGQGILAVHPRAMDARPRFVDARPSEIGSEPCIPDSWPCIPDSWMHGPNVDARSCSQKPPKKKQDRASTILAVHPRVAVHPSPWMHGHGPWPCIHDPGQGPVLNFFLGATLFTTLPWPCIHVPGRASLRLDARPRVTPATSWPCIHVLGCTVLFLAVHPRSVDARPSLKNLRLLSPWSSGDFHVSLTLHIPMSASADIKSEDHGELSSSRMQNIRD